MTLQFERKYSTQGSGAPCHVSFGFFSGFYSIPTSWQDFRLTLSLNLRFDLRLEGYIPYGKCDSKNRIPALRQGSIIEDLQEESSRTLGNYSRRLQNYSRISWSTFQPRDASSTLEDFWLVVLGLRLRTTRQGRQDYLKLSYSTTKYLGACATRHLMAWGARTTVEKYSDRKLYMSCSM
jgi:hypothetical protein